MSAYRKAAEQSESTQAVKRAPWNTHPPGCSCDDCKDEPAECCICGALVGPVYCPVCPTCIRDGQL